MKMKKLAAALLAAAVLATTVAPTATPVFAATTAETTATDATPEQEVTVKKQVVYNGLQKKEVTPISPEGDTYFYNNWWDLKRKKYIRVVKFYGDTGIDDSIKMMEGDEAERDMFVDICTSQQIYHTLQYAESELGITETQGLNGDFKNEAITGDKGLTIRGDSQTETIENIPDMILVQYKNSGYKYFVVGKTLYVDNSGYMMAMLSYSGMSYDDFMDSYDKKIVKLRNCFNNIKQLAY